MTVYTSSRGKSSPLHSYPLTTFHLHLRSWKKNQQMRRHKKIWSIEDTWMTRSTVWTVPTWSVFNQSIRTNNDVEGWHHKLNRKARKKTADTDEDDLRGETQKIQMQKEPYRSEPSTTATKSVRIISWRSVVQSTVPGARRGICILYIVHSNVKYVVLFVKYSALS